MNSNDYLDMLSLEDKYTKSPTTWEIAQTFPECRFQVKAIIRQLKKELDFYRPYIAENPFNINYMRVDPRFHRLNELEKYMKFTEPVKEDSKKITDQMIQKAKNVPMRQLYDFQYKNNRVRCPFHEDKNPSSKINKDNTFHCFVCNIHLDTIEFIKKLYGINFIESVRRLCDGV